MAAVRTGEVAAFGELYERHVVAARRLAATLVRDPADAQDLVAETFAKILARLRDGRGPDMAFRAYLLTTLRHVCYDRARREKRLQLTDDITQYETGTPFDDPAVADLDRSYAARAFARLPERWQAVLWHTEVEGETPAQVAPLLGLTPNGVSALAYRARDRLRQLYLQEHVASTDDPACHQTAERLSGYVRGNLPARERSRVDGHLNECAACRLLHRELVDVNSRIGAVLAPLVLGGSAAAYLAEVGGGPVVAGGLAGVLGTAWAAVTGWSAAAWAAVWRWSAAACAAVAGWSTVAWAAVTGWIKAAATWPARQVRGMIQRHGPGRVTGTALAGAVAVGLALLVFLLVAHPSPQRPQARRPAAPVPPAPARPATPQPPAPAAPTDRPTTPARPPAGNPPATRPSRPAPTSPTAVPADLEITPDLFGGQLVAATTGALPVTVRAPKAARASRSTRAPESSRTRPAGAARSTRTVRPVRLEPAAWQVEVAELVELVVTLPPGVRAAGTDAGDGWRCTASRDGATCHRRPLPSGGQSTARIPVRVADDVTGFQPVRLAITMGSRQTRVSFRVPVAPAGTTVGYAATGQVRAALAGNTLLSCPTRPACLTGGLDNHQLPMVPYLPGAGEPTPPRGLLDPAGPPGPDGPIRELAGLKAASGAALAVPSARQVRWAGLYWASAGHRTAGVVALHGPGGSWHRVTPHSVRSSYGERPLRQAYADVTTLVRTAGGGPWWLAAPAKVLPSGSGAYAGWSLVVVYDDRAAPTADLAVYAGPAPLRGTRSLAVRAGAAGSRAQVGLVAWDGDRNLTGDSLRLGDTPLGDPDNVAGGVIPSALECAEARSRCGWNGLGVDIASYTGTLDRTGMAALRAGQDPIDAGVLTVAATAPRASAAGAGVWRR